ncbi:lipoprotein-releasing ABC transporter permease subunit LolE [Shewanella corallii]|uniref:Lipoprotein-releasing ABC transporter permease subunit LolE n=1 Tax=Shewanella corallii TaxID=560080 RepID=A0ABT0N7B1_9GAMM|nr:lipoprotein-releasing ABC transporter permease subunit LolE [Shewanella corallii]MCL2914336.1 lipoprotein-releasing ABC transporter permease subunit LolE [Shewanella corallii]
MKSLMGFWIGWRFYRARQANGFISFISFASTAGISLGVAVLIIVLSAMNGFERELQNRFLGVVPHGELIGAAEPVHNWPGMLQSALVIPGVSGAAPFIRIEGLVQKPGGFQGLAVTGIDTRFEPEVSVIRDYMSPQAWQSLESDKNHIVLGEGLMRKLGLKIGDKLSLYVPSVSNGQSTRLGGAKSHRFVITGTFKLGGELELANAYIPMAYAAGLLNMGDSVTGLRIKVDDVFMAPSLIRELGFKQDQYLYMNDWTRTQGHLYQDIQLVRVVMYLVLALVIAVACFNIVSTLVMAVRDKASEIAILMTMGVRRGAVMTIFVVQGALNGILGCLLGGTIGTLVAINLSSIAKGIESLFSVQLLAGDIYFIDFLPSQLELSDVVLVLGMALLMSLIATLYPAFKASKIMPARALSGR